MLTALAAYSVQRLVVSNSWTEHTLSVLNEVGQLDDLLAETEAAGRGFFITADSQFLPPYEAARRGVPQVIRRLRQLTEDNPRQQRSLDVLELLIAECLETIGSVIGARRVGSPPDVLVEPARF